MDVVEFLKIFAFIFGISALVVYLLHKVRLPPVIGFLISGVIIGPYGAKLVERVEVVQVLAEVGIILLLFVLGLELSLTKLLEMRRFLLVAGGAQIIMTVFLFTILSLLFFELNLSIFIGLIAALSSTAIVLKYLFDSGEIDSSHGRVTTGITIFQDLVAIFITPFIPLFLSSNFNPSNFLVKLLNSSLILIFVVWASRKLVPPLLFLIAKSRIRDLFIISVLFLCFSVALIVSELGFSLAFGAFVAGLLISESEYSHQVTADIIPFRESLMAIFFVSIGMLLNVNFLMENFRVVVLISLLIILIKILGTSLGILISGGGIKTAFISGILLAPISEFSFVLILLGKKFGLVDDRIYQFFIASAVITMVLSPILFTYVHNLAAFVGNYIKVKDESWERLKRESELREHVIIIGFGLNGRSVARVLKGIGIPYVVIELNISTVKKMREVGELIFHGDATSPDVLRKAGIEEAKLMIITISDPVSSKRIVAIARSLNSNIYIIVRTRYVAEVEELRKLGANEVIPEEFEISVEIANRVLNYFKFPINLTKEYVSRLKEGSYELFRRDDVSFNELVQNLALPKNLSEHLRRVEFETYWVKSNSRAKQTSIGEMALRSRTGVTVLIVKRGEEIFINPSADFKFEVGDLVVLMGERNKIEKAIQLLDNGEA